MPGRKSNQEEMKIHWGSALGTLELFSIPIEKQEIYLEWDWEIRGIIVDRPIVGKVGIIDAKA